MNKFRVLLGACGIHLSIGSVHAWSVLVNPIVNVTGWPLSSVTFAFSLAILFLGTSAGFLGNKVTKWGPNKSGIIATTFFASGLVISNIALLLENIWLLYIGYCVIGGIGLGIGYITPISTLLKWFPEKKGFAGGCAVMSFGFAAALSSNLIHLSLEYFDIYTTLLNMAAVYFTLMTVSSLMIVPASKENLSNKVKSKDKPLYDNMSTSNAVRTKEFAILWTVFFINITCGISLLSIASPMAQQLGATAAASAALVGFLGIANGVGRILSAIISDRYGRCFVYLMFFLIEAYAFAILGHLDDSLSFMMFQVLLFAIIFCYGGGFSCMPAFLADIYGLTHLSAIHGRILTAWGIAGIVGPLLITKTYETTGSYAYALNLFALMFLMSLALMAFMNINIFRKTGRRI